uniref:ComEC/Rec2 family competence protein n=1 Tax=Candidatus Planktophila sp. TaxID=2175601 RepID=UPI004049920B
MGAYLQSWSAPWSITAVALLALLISYRAKKLRILFLALLLGAAMISLRLAALESSQLQSYLGQKVDLVVQVTTDPVRAAPKVFGDNFAPVTYSFLAQALEVDQRYKLRIPVRILVSTESLQELLPGQEIALRAKIIKSREARVAALAIVDGPITIITPPSTWATQLAGIRQGLRDATGGGDAGALIPGMVIGDTSKQSPEFKNEMRRSGLTHLVAVSGANFAIVSAFVLYVMQFIFRKKSYRLIATALALLAFIALVRPSPSVLRAAAMAAVLLAAHGLHRGRDALPALGFAMGAVVIADPFQSREPGFALSVLATGGLLLLAPRIRPQILAPPIAAMVFCSPVIVALSGYISPMSVVANILAAPAVTPITIVGFLAALLSPLSPTLAQLLILLIKPFAAWIALVADWSARFPVFTLRTGLYGFIAVVLIIILIHWGRRKVAIAFLVVIFSLTWVQRFPAGQWDIVNCDVGQGDALVINLQNNRALVIDVGPDPELIDRCLRRLKVKEIPLLILTHSHADHVGGLAGASKRRVIGTTWYGNIRAGGEANLGDIKVKVHWPDAGEYSPNNSSIATTITSKDFTLFAAGDLEPEAQSRLRGRIGAVDIYKVSHHGSKFQDFTLLKELAPKLAVISVGAENTFGHPAPNVLQALEEIGARVLRTDSDGAVAITADQYRYTIQKAQRWSRIFFWS